VSRVTPQGAPVAIALSTRLLATLEQGPRGLRLAWYDPATGVASGAVPVPASTAPELAANDQAVVFRVGRSIRVLNVATQRPRELAHAPEIPVGLSLEGRRVAWADNVGGLGRIRAVFLSG
jgi:hypothetical protein